MKFNDDIHIHNLEPRFKDFIIAWETRKDCNYRFCNYCGSLHPQDFYELLELNTATLADEKYGYPHKFYLGIYKFYTKHLADIDDKETLEKMLNRIYEKTRVKFKSHLEK